MRQVFTNENGDTGVLNLVSSDCSLTYEQITTIYQKRWKVETYHKSLKSNLALTKSPTRVVLSQGNHIFASLLAFVKLESLHIQTKLNHFALKTKLYRAALKTAFTELQILKERCSPGIVCPAA